MVSHFCSVFFFKHSSTIAIIATSILLHSPLLCLILKLSKSVRLNLDKVHIQDCLQYKILGSLTSIELSLMALLFCTTIYLIILLLLPYTYLFTSNTLSPLYSHIGIGWSNKSITSNITRLFWKAHHHWD